MAEVPNGAIGAAIDGEEQKKGNAVQSFFTNPKNLATLLVLGTALAQNRRGQSFGAHLGKAATGALGFRGALDRDIENRALEKTEQQSVQQRRMDQTATEQAGVAAQNRRTEAMERGQDIRAETADEDREAALQRARIARTEISPAPMNLDRVYANIRKDVSDAYAAWYASGQFGAPPDANEIATRHLRLWELQQNQVTGTFEGALPSSGEEVVEPPGAPDAVRPISATTRTFALTRLAETLGFERGTSVAPEEVDTAIRRYDAEVMQRAQSGDMTPEEAKALRNGPEQRLLSTRTKAALQQIEQQEARKLLVPTAATAQKAEALDEAEGRVRGSNIVPGLGYTPPQD